VDIAQPFQGMFEKIFCAGSEAPDSNDIAPDRRRCPTVGLRLATKDRSETKFTEAWLPYAPRSSLVQRGVSLNRPCESMQTF
jgi:hypothetical protein